MVDGIGKELRMDRDAVNQPNSSIALPQPSTTSSKTVFIFFEFGVRYATRGVMSMLVAGAVDLVTTEVLSWGSDSGGAVNGIDRDDDQWLDLGVAGADEG